MQNKSKKSAVRSLAVMVLFLLIAIGLVVELLRIYVPNVWAAFSSGDENALQTCFDGQSTAYSAGLLWLLSFVQILSVVLPAMPVQLVAGIVLGPWLGCAVCLTACMAAHIAVFYAATHAQTSLAALEEASPKLKKARDALSVKRNRTYYTTILLLAPGLPNGIIPYAAAHAGLQGRRYFLALLLALPVPTFVKNIIMDNILPGDIYIRAKELHFATDAPRAVFLIRQVGRSDVATVDVLSGMFPDKMQDFVLSINESDVAVVKQITANTPSEELEKIAQDIENTLKNELRIKTSIGIGTVSEHLRELADSYKEAQTAIEVGKVFDTEKSIMRYENLGIGRLIYQLPTTLCEIFLSEIFKKSSIDCLDQETLFTINKFFENNLNVSETSRKLFVHRNTLVYRLEKIKKLTGLDLRQFDHAIVFKVALMVRKYLSSREAR